MSAPAEIATWFPPTPWTVVEEAGDLFVKDARGVSFVKVYVGSDDRAAHVAQAIASLPALLIAADRVIETGGVVVIGAAARLQLTAALWTALGRIDGGAMD